MANSKVKVDLNNPEFQESWLKLDKDERNRVCDTLSKLVQLDWSQVYTDKGLHWEKIVSIKPIHGIQVLYSLRITKSSRAIAYREGDFMKLLLVEPEHDAAYGKK